MVGKRFPADRLPGVAPSQPHAQRELASPAGAALLATGLGLQPLASGAHRFQWALLARRQRRRHFPGPAQLQRTSLAH